MQTKDAFTAAEHKAQVTWMDSWQSVLNLLHFFKKNLFCNGTLEKFNKCLYLTVRFGFNYWFDPF